MPLSSEPVPEDEVLARQYIADHTDDLDEEYEVLTALGLL